MNRASLCAAAVTALGLSIRAHILAISSTPARMRWFGAKLGRAAPEERAHVIEGLNVEPTGVRPPHGARPGAAPA